MVARKSRCAGYRRHKWEGASAGSSGSAARRGCRSPKRWFLPTMRSPSPVAWLMRDYGVTAPKTVGSLPVELVGDAVVQGGREGSPRRPHHARHSAGDGGGCHRHPSNVLVARAHARSFRAVPFGRGSAQRGRRAGRLGAAPTTRSHGSPPESAICVTSPNGSTAAATCGPTLAGYRDHVKPVIDRLGAASLQHLRTADLDEFGDAATHRGSPVPQHAKRGPPRRRGVGVPCGSTPRAPATGSCATRWTSRA